MLNELAYRLALTCVPQIGCIQIRILIRQFGTAEAIFKARKSDLERTEGIGPIRARAIKNYTDFSIAEKELPFLEKYSVRPLFITDKDYPQRLLHCYDPPSLLFYKGNTNLNAGKTIAVIGTRSHSDYGRQVTEKLIRDLAEMNVLVVSGLAYGVDAIAHRAALHNGLPTVAVLAHGLDKMYPAEHSALAKQIAMQGGLLTEFRSTVKPDKHHFPIRNRIVAGMCDATVVVETGIRGGSMITAELANGYNRDVFAFPGKTSDIKSAGCNQLIKTNKAVLLTDAQQLIEYMGWNEQDIRIKTAVQKQLFPELTGNEKIIATLLQEKPSMHIDELNIRTNMSSSAVAESILQLELRGVIRSLPGKIYVLEAGESL